MPRIGIYVGQATRIAKLRAKHVVGQGHLAVL
jgi:hypothetical protein